MKKIVILLIITSSIMAQPLEFGQKLYEQYSSYRETSLNEMRFKHADILPLLEHHKSNTDLTIEKLGESILGKSIYSVTLGSGSRSVFLWSQMHGDEPTATAALFDILNFFAADDGLGSYKEQILSEFTITMIPMVNPDGADLFQRRNFLSIDLNRDAVRLVSPESKILMETYKRLEPEIAFNLHDQMARYSAGETPNQVALAFLAPAFNKAKDMDESREAAMRLIVTMKQVLERYIPGHLARYSDEFEPRAFGDMFQKMGAATILIESGGWMDDPEKQFIRKLNFIAIVAALLDAAQNGHTDNDIAEYNKIPRNENSLFDLMIRKVLYNDGKADRLIDIGINRSDVNINKASDYYMVSSIDDIGDLSIYYGIEEYDFSGMSVQPGRIYPEPFAGKEDVEKLDYDTLYAKGFTGIIIDSSAHCSNLHLLPFSIYCDTSAVSKPRNLKRGKPADLIISDEKGIAYVIVNGYLHDVRSSIGTIRNGRVIR